MTQDEIIEMAKEAGLETQDGLSESVFYFAKLIADKRVEGMVVMTPDEFKSVWDKAQAEEREACAKEADKRLHDYTMLTSNPPQSGAAWSIASAIRARGQA